MSRVFSFALHAAVVGALLLLWHPSVAQYMNRAQEVDETLTQTIEYEPLRNLLATGLASVFEQRNGALVEAVRLLDNDSTSEREVDDRWNHHFQDTATAIQDQLTRLADEAFRLVSDLEDAEVFQKVELVPERVRDLARQQARLLRAIWHANPGAARDVFVSFRALYSEEHENLTARHDGLRRAFRDIEADSASYREDILEATEDMIKRVDDALDDADDYLQRAASGEPDPDAVESRLSGFVGAMVRAIDEFRAAAVEALDRLVQTDRREVLQIRMLNDTRTRVGEMVDARNPPIANALFHENETAVNRLHVDQPPGDVRDIAVFAPAVSDLIENHLENFEVMFGQFSERFEGVFVEAVSAGTIDEFLVPSRWEPWASSISRMDAVRYLNSLGGRSRWDVEFRNLSPGDADIVEDILGEQSARLEDAAERAISVASRLERVASLERRRILRGMFED